MPADVWVVNASPLITLAHAGQLELLERLAEELVVPEAVAVEVLAGPEDPARRALEAGWGNRAPVIVPLAVTEWSLGKGESAVLALALERGATAILDDGAARRAAKAFGLAVTGTFGVIVRAKRRRLIDAAKPVVRAVLDAGLYYDDDAVRALLEAIGESWP